MLCFFSSPPFYNNYVQLPCRNAPLPAEIKDKPKFYPFFKDTLRVIDGTHFNCCLSTANWEAARDCKENLTQNCLAICGFDMTFYYMFSGWEGSIADSTRFHNVRITDLPIPAGKYYLANAGFPTTTLLMIPFHGKCYYLREWGHAKTFSMSAYVQLGLLLMPWLYRPQNAEEFFNLQHAYACNLIKHIFGVLKWHFCILVHPPQFNMHTQAHLPPALAAIHNFICKHDPHDLDDYENIKDPQPGSQTMGGVAEGQFSAGFPRPAKRRQADARWNRIAQDMWEQYIAENSWCNQSRQ